MIELYGKYNIAKVFTDNIESTAIGQIVELCNQEFAKDSKIRIMPDTHAGAGCTIGTTMTIKDKIVPNLVGVDIGCGMYCVKINERQIKLKELDDTIRKYIPSGQKVREVNHNYARIVKLEDLRCFKYINKDRALKSIGTLGGGNHFIEVNKDINGNLYLVIHSGSRYLGKQVAEYYQEKAFKKLSDNKKIKSEIIANLKQQGRECDIQNEISKISLTKFNKQLAYVEGSDFDDYLHDMKIVQKYATINRIAIADDIMRYMNLTMREYFTTIHNYIDLDNKILRKGAIAAKHKEKVIIPINMRDGSIIAIGKGNPDWNYSAPHGAGRLMSRSKAKKNVNIEDYKKSMDGIYTTSVNEYTIDESPMVYKPIEEILQNIKDTVEILDIIKPIYNYKASN